MAERWPQAWTDLPTLKGNPAFQQYVDTYNQLAAKFPGGDSDLTQKQAEYQAQAKQMLSAAQSDPAYQAKMSKWKDDAAAGPGGWQAPADTTARSATAQPGRGPQSAHGSL